MDGIRLNDCESLEAFGVNKQKVVEEITRAYAHQIYVDGFFNGDPHPGTCLLFIVSRLFLLFFALVLQIVCQLKSLSLFHQGVVFSGHTYGTCLIIAFSLLSQMHYWVF